jgi:hypothetical protein
MDEDSDQRKRDGTLKLKGEGQGFTLRGYTIVLKKPITPTTAVSKNCVSKSGRWKSCLTHCSWDNYTINMYIGEFKTETCQYLSRFQFG